MKEKVLDYIKNNYKVLVVCLVLLVITFGLFFNLDRTVSDVDHKEFVYIYSDNSDFYEREPGAWILYKNAYLLNADRLRIRYNINSNTLLSEKPKDVLFVIDNAESSLYNYCGSSGVEPMSQGPSNDSCVINKTSEATYQLLVEESDLDNKVGIVTYNDDYQIRSYFTDNEGALQDIIYDIEAEGYTDYSKALAGIDKFLENYQYTNDRELIIILYVGNVSKENNTVEKQLFEELKQKYPYVRINALHNVVDNETILEKIRNISDAQYLIQENRVHKEIASKSNFDNIQATPLLQEEYLDYYSFNNIFSRLIFSKKYTQFKIIDNINNEFFNFTNFKVIDKNNGTVDYVNNTLTWTLDRQMLSGEYVYLEVELGVNKNVILTDNLVPVSTSMQIKSILEGIPDENVNTNLTPYVNFYNKVIYDTSSLPVTCNVTPIPSETYKIGEIVDIKTKVPNCDGYKFVQWVPDYHRYYYDSYNLDGFLLDVSNKKSDGKIKFMEQLNPGDEHNGQIFANIYELVITNGSFKMPGYDVILLPIFEKVAVNKSIETGITAELESGSYIESQIYSAAGCNTFNSSCNKVVAFKRSEDEPSSYRTISTNYSDYPVKIWYNSSDQTIYYYSAAEKIYMNENSSNLLYGLSALNDIDGLQYFDSSRVKNMAKMFSGCRALGNLTPIGNWDVSNVKDMSSMLSGGAISNLEPIREWDVSNVKNMSYMLASNTFLKNLEPIGDWNISSVEDISYMFSGNYWDTDISPLSNWDVSNVKNMKGLFANDSLLSDFSPISGWDVSNVTNMNRMFYNTKLSNLNYFSTWDISNATDIGGMFALCYTITDLTPISGWNTSKVTNLSYFFAGMRDLTDLTPISGWDTSKVEDMSYMFASIRYYTNDPYRSPGVTNLTPISGWNTSKVTNMSYMFYMNDVISNIDPMNNWNVSNVENMDSFMNNATKIESLTNLGNLHFSKVNKFTQIFEGATSLKDATIVRDFNLSHGSLWRMFFNCTSLVDISAVSNWDTSNVYNMQSTFAGSGITDYSPIRNWNTSSVLHMDSMFENSQISDLSVLSNWNVSNNSSFSYMFKNATSITDASAINNWNISENAYFTEMFKGVSTHPTFTKVHGCWSNEGTFYPGECE